MDWANLPKAMVGRKFAVLDCYAMTDFIENTQKFMNFRYAGLNKTYFLTFFKVFRFVVDRQIP